MKKILQLLLLLFAWPGFFIYAQVKKITVSAEIESVTVYMQGAVVKRSGQLSLPAGRSELVLSNVSNEIEPQSVELGMDAELTILSVGTRKNFLHEKEAVVDTRDLGETTQRIE